MPDIDIDFSVKGRERVIQYVAEKYGRERWRRSSPSASMLPRAATRDAARVLGMDYGAGDRVAKLIPEPVMGRSKTSTSTWPRRTNSRVYDTDPDARRMIDEAQGARGDRPQRLHPRGRRRDRGQAPTDIVPLQLS